MKNALYNKPNYVLLVLFSLIFFLGNSQQPNDAYLFDAYKNYSNLKGEIAYDHLNTSTLTKEESLRFSICFLEQYIKKSSVLTKNMYCTIQNRSGTIVKKKMILDNNGIIDWFPI
jgi:hypothetical protein